MIIDTSALLSIYIPEKLSNFVRREVEKSESCYFLDLIFYEFPNAVRKRVVRDELSKEDGEKILGRGLDFVNLCKVASGNELAMESYRIGLNYNLTTYDASLIALAEKVNDVILTTDEKLLSGVEGSELSKYFIFPQ
jgi:predicted nucleic acid-binding protein